MIDDSDSPFKNLTSHVRLNRPLPPGVRKVEDCQYVTDGHPRHRLDLYLPEHLDTPGPVILWIHGGGWYTGDKAGGPAIAFATRGFAVASMNYRLSQHDIFPAQIHDCKAAVRWLRANASHFGFSRERLGVWGCSAGGQLAALLGTTAGVMELEGSLGNANQSSAVQAVVDWFGPTNFLTLGPKQNRTQFLGGDALAFPDKARAASPINYVTESACPFFIVHGDQDTLVPIEQSCTMAEALQSAGVETTFVTITGGNHGGSRFARPEQLQQIESFFVRHLKCPQIERT